MEVTDVDAERAQLNAQITVAIQATGRHSEREARIMKTMTCGQLGGPCDSPHQGTTADEVIKAQDRHLNEMVASGDTAHEGALKEMKGRWKKPIKGMGWYRQAKREFAALPED
jgi:hypothetical protein